MKNCRYLFIFIYIVSNTIYGHQPNTTPIVKKENELEVIVALSIPPFIIENTSTGLELDIIREALSSVNHNVIYTHMPLGSTIMGLKRLQADAVGTFLPNKNFPDVFASEPYIQYKNVAVTLVKNNISINSVEDLAGKKVFAFQKASLYLGDRYLNSIKNARYYREVADQSKQIELLFSGKAEVIILDISIFRYSVQNNKKYNKAYKIHPILGKVEYSLGFYSNEKKALFNQGLKQIKEQGIYQNIWDKYILRH